MIHGSATVADLRETLERRRREELHREIAALKTALGIAAAGNHTARTRTIFKLRSKIRRKERELLQPMLIYSSR